jgi:hypothetical protein
MPPDGIVGRVPVVLRERDGVGDLVRHGVDAGAEPEKLERGHQLRVELGHRARSERDRRHPPVVDVDAQLLVDEVERQLEGARA